MAPFWDMVEKAANLFQLFGLDAITLVAIATSFLQFHELIEERKKLEERVRMLRLLLLSPAGCWIMMQHLHQQQHSELRGGLVVAMSNALRDAHDLVECYDGSTLLTRLRRGRSMATRFRHLRRSLDSYCSLILSINAFLLFV